MNRCRVWREVLAAMQAQGAIADAEFYAWIPPRTLLAETRQRLLAGDGLDYDDYLETFFQHDGILYPLNLRSTTP